MSVLGTIAGVAAQMASLYANHRQNQQNIELQESANKANVHLAQLQNQYNVEQWYRQNAYNTPNEQVKRLKAAGLNPNLMYGNGATSTGISTSSPQMVSGSGTQQAARVGSVMQGVDPLVMAQIANINADTRQKDAQTDVSKAQIPLMTKQGQLTESQTANVNQSTTNLQADWSKLRAQIDNIDADTDNKRYQGYLQQLQQMASLILQGWTPTESDYEHTPYGNMYDQFVKEYGAKFNASWDHDSKLLQSKILTAQGDTLTVQADWAKDYYSLSQGIGVAGNAVKILQMLISAFKH